MLRLKREHLFDPSKKIFDILEYDKVMNYTEKDDYKTWILLVLSLWMETHEFS